MASTASTATGLPLYRQRFAVLLLALTAVIAVGACSAPRPASGLGPQAVAIAAQQNGKGYQWGAAGPSTFDCSGLTSYVYGRLGRYLPHNSNAQSNVTAHVPQNAKAPGDLILFGSPGNVYHVAIYAGGNMIWAAPSPGSRVRLQPIWTSAYMVGRVR